MRAVIIAAILFAATLPAQAYAQFNKAMATNVANARFGWTVPAFEIYTGTLEKAKCAGVATNAFPDPPAEGAGMFDHRTVGLAYKDFIADTVLPLYINHTVTNASGIYESSNTQDFVMWDATSACIAVGISTNYLDVHGWFSWYDTNSWQHFADILNLCRWTKTDIVSATTNEVNPGNQRYNLENRAGGTFDVDAETAWDNATNAWNAGTFIDTNTCGESFSASPFYAAIGWHDAPLHNFGSWRTAGWSYANDIPTNVSHRLHIFGQTVASTNSGNAICELLHATNIFHDVGTGYIEGQFRRLLQVNGGSVVTTNHREMTEPIFAVKVNTAAANNPLESIPVAFTNELHAKGFRVKWEDTWFLFEWDANASTGMQYIFD